MTPVIAATGAERVVAGSVLRDPDVIDDALAVVAPDDFADHPTRLVVQAVTDLRQDGRPVNAELVFLLLRHRSRVDDLGAKPPQFLADLLDHAPTAANWENAAGQVRDASLRRKVAGIATEMLRDAASPTGPADELVETFARRVAEVADRHAPADGPELLRDLLARAYSRYDEMADGKGSQPVPTGFGDLDRVMAGGFRPRVLMYVGARTGKGKSALLLRFAEAAARGGHPVLLHTLEMTSDEVMDRQVAANADVPHVLLHGDKVRQTPEQAGRVTGLMDAEFGRLGDLSAVVNNLPSGAADSGNGRGPLRAGENVARSDWEGTSRSNPLEMKAFEDARGRVKTNEKESRLRDLNPGPPLYESQS